MYIAKLLKNSTKNYNRYFFFLKKKISLERNKILNKNYQNRHIHNK